MILISFLRFMKKQEATAARRPWKKEEEQEIQEATGSWAAAKNIRADAAVAAVLSEMGGFFILRGREKNVTEGFFFFNGKDVFAWFLTGFGKNLVKQRIETEGFSSLLKCLFACCRHLNLCRSIHPSELS